MKKIVMLILIGLYLMAGLVAFAQQAPIKKPVTAPNKTLPAKKVTAKPATAKQLSPAEKWKAVPSPVAGSKNKPVVKLKPLDSAEAIYVAKQIMDSFIFIGTFEAAGMKTAVRQLKNGTTPELEEMYLDVVMGQRLTKLNTLQAIRGSFDSMIFLQMPTINTDAEEPLQFYPYPDTKWLLFFTSPYKVDGTPSENWTEALRRLNTDKYLNAKTVYAVTSVFHGNEILEWNYDYETGIVAYSINTGFANEMPRLLELVEAAKKAKAQGATPTPLSHEKWNDEGMKKLAAKLDGMLSMKVKTPEEESTKDQ